MEAEPTHVVYYYANDPVRMLFVRENGQQTVNCVCVFRGSKKECNKYVLYQQRTGGRRGPERGTHEDPHG